MAAPRTVLENLLARVRQRAAEPRPTAAPAPVAPPREIPRVEPPIAVQAAPAKARVVEEEEIEEYDDELVEIIDEPELDESAEVEAPAALKGPAAAKAPPTLAPSAPQALPPQALPPQALSPQFGEPRRGGGPSARPGDARPYGSVPA